MGRMINTTSMTVDGVIDVSDWFVAEGDHDAVARSLFEGDAAMFLGRKNYEGFAGFWPTQTGPWADLLNAMPKFVVSRTPLGKLEWNATAMEGDATDTARQLKAERAGDLIVTGAGELARQLVEAGLVDELQFWVHPRIQGPGTRPYDAATIPIALLESRQFESGVTLLRYRPISAAA